jgi:hypothetical protein
MVKTFPGSNKDTQSYDNVIVIENVISTAIMLLLRWKLQIL